MSVPLLETIGLICRFRGAFHLKVLHQLLLIVSASTDDCCLNSINIYKIVHLYPHNSSTLENFSEKGNFTLSTNNLFTLKMQFIQNRQCKCLF